MDWVFDGAAKREVRLSWVNWVGNGSDCRKEESKLGGDRRTTLDVSGIFGTPLWRRLVGDWIIWV